MILYKVNISNKKEVIKWLNKIRAGTGDARPLWTALIRSGKIEEFINYEFDQDTDSHKIWTRLTPKYKKWKEKKFGFSGMGYLHGNLQSAAGKRAKRRLKAKSLIWMLNTNVPAGKGKTVDDYVKRFHFGFSGVDRLGRHVDQPPRQIYRYTYLRVSSFLKLDAKKFKSGITHASFTYNWLRKALEVR